MILYRLTMHINDYYY